MDKGICSVYHQKYLTFVIIVSRQLYEQYFDMINVTCMLDKFVMVKVFIKLALAIHQKKVHKQTFSHSHPYPRNPKHGIA